MQSTSEWNQRRRRREISREDEADEDHRHGHQHVEAALDETLEELGLGYLDLYLMHWPVENVEGRNFIEFIDVRPPSPFYHLSLTSS